MSAEPGWYYCQGDPENTLRRWNGMEWIGFPIEQNTNTPDRVAVAGVKPFKPIPGQVSLDLLSVAVRAGLFLTMIAHGVLAFTVYQNLQYDPVEALQTLEPAPIENVTVFTGVFVVALLTGLLFIAWFATAYSNLSKWHHVQRSTGWAWIIFFVPGLMFRWPWNMMLELVEQSARPDRQGEITPFAVLGWWVMWTSHQTLFLASIGLNRYANVDFLAGLNEYYFAIAGSVLAMIGIVFAIYLVGAISAAQETRRRPTVAQRALMSV